MAAFPLVTKSLWLEECSNRYIKIIRNPMGIEYPDKDHPETEKSCIREKILVGNLKRIQEEYLYQNLWRSWEIFFDSSCEKAESHIPVFFDIDYLNRNLKGAYELTIHCLNILENDERFQGNDRLRVVFSGHKGFHIEGRPKKPLNNQSLRENILVELEKRGIKHINGKNEFENGIIDPIHDFVRVTGSINSWFEEGLIKKRRVIQLSLEEFKEYSIERIINKSEDI